MSATLMLHAGGAKATRDEVFSIEAPAATDTWHPCAHGAVVTRIEDVLDSAGYNITRQEFGLSHHGARFFGVFDLENEIVPGVTLSIGLRNSIDKSFPYGLTGGNRVFVCDNLALTGDLIDIRRKHSKRGQESFAQATAAAIRNLSEFRKVEERRIRFMQETELTGYEGEAFLLKAFELGILSHRLLPEAIRQFREPTHDWGRKGTLWHLFNAMTTPLQARVKSNPRVFSAATMRLMELIGPKSRIGYDGATETGVVLDVTPTATDSPGTTA